MSEEFKLEIVNPKKSFLSKEDVIEVLVPAYEGDMGILKDHIPLISFLKPGIIDVKSKNETLNFYVDDGIVEFKDNTLSILTSSIHNLKELDKFQDATFLSFTKCIIKNNVNQPVDNQEPERFLSSPVYFLNILNTNNNINTYFLFNIFYII